MGGTGTVTGIDGGKGFRRCVVSCAAQAAQTVANDGLPLVAGWRIVSITGWRIMLKLLMCLGKTASAADLAVTVPAARRAA